MEVLQVELNDLDLNRAKRDPECCGRFDLVAGEEFERSHDLVFLDLLE